MTKDQGCAQVSRVVRSEAGPPPSVFTSNPTVSLDLTFQSHLTTLDLGLECLGLVAVWTISKIQGGHQAHDVRPMPLAYDWPSHRAQGQLAERPQEGDPVLCAEGRWERNERSAARAGLRGKDEQQGTHLWNVRATQGRPRGEQVTTKAQARKAQKQQDQSGTDQRGVVGQTEMQVVPCLAAAHGE